MVKKNLSETSCEASMSAEKSVSNLSESKLAAVNLSTNDDSKTRYSTTVQNPEKEFEFVKYDIDREIKALLINNQISLYEKINPISQDNVENIKAALINILSEVEFEYRELIKKKILQCETAKELFATSKSILLNCLQSVQENKISMLCESVKAKKISLKKFDKVICEINNKNLLLIKKITELFMVKTTRPEVFKIEEEVKNMGVQDVRFSNDLDLAILIKEAVVDLVKAKIQLPESIIVTPIIPMGTIGYNINGISENINVGHVFLQTSNEYKFNDFLKKGIVEQASHTEAFKNASTVNKNKYINMHNNFADRLISTENSKHRIYHIFAHSFSPVSLESVMQTLSTDDMKVAKSISKYAARSINGCEVVPELFAKLMDKQKLTHEQMELYIRLGGVVPKA